MSGENRAVTGFAESIRNLPLTAKKSARTAHRSTKNDLRNLRAETADRKPMAIIVNHNSPIYKARYNAARRNRYNGAYYYSREICDIMIPLVKTNRNWITVNSPGEGADHAIVFVHNNKEPRLYDWLSDFSDLILVCGIPSTCDKVSHLGRAIYLPLSVDVEYVKQFRVEKKTEHLAFAGRGAKRIGASFDKRPHYLEAMPRERLLRAMAKYRKIYAVGRTAIEAKILGCEVLPYDERFPDPGIWKILDTRDAAKMLQEKLNRLDE